MLNFDRYMVLYLKLSVHSSFYLMLASAPRSSFFFLFSLHTDLVFVNLICCEEKIVAPFPSLKIYQKWTPGLRPPLGIVSNVAVSTGVLRTRLFVRAGFFLIFSTSYSTSPV